MFGGYDMGCVDDFLEPLSEDYISLFKENAVLKSKMKILVEKLEEYRAQEETMKKALFTAQKTSDTLIEEAQEKCANMRNDLELSMRSQVEDVHHQVEVEKDRIDRAKQAATNFIEIIEKDVKQHLDLLNSLKLMNLAPATPKVQLYDFEKESLDKSRQPAPVHAPVAAEEPTQPTESTQPTAPRGAIKIVDESADATAEMVSEIEQNVERIMGNATNVDLNETLIAPAGASKFSDLQFGKNYDQGK